MKRSLLQQTVHTLFSILAGQGAMIAAGIAISRVYGPVGKGVVSYAGIGIIAAVSIGEGFSLAISRIVGAEPERVAVAYAAARRIVIIISALIVPPIALIGILVPSQHALIAVAIAWPFALYLQTMNGFHLIALRVERTNYASLATNAGTGVAILLAIASRHVDIWGILAIWVAGYAVGAALTARGIHQLARAVRSEEVRAMLAELFRFGRLSSLASLATYFSVRIDVFIVSAMLSAVSLGNYTLAIAVGELMWQVSRAISWSSYGRIATASFADGAAIAARVSRLVIALEIVSAAIAFTVGPWLVTLVYGAAFAAARVPLRILLPGMAVYAADSILSYFLSVRANRPGLIVRIELITLSVCAIVTFATIGRFGIAGAAIATTVAYAISFGAKATFFVRLTGLSPWDLLVVRRGDFDAFRGTGRTNEPVVAPAP